MLPIRRSERQKVKVGRCLAGMMALLAVSSILISNVLLHRSIDESAGLNWAAIHRLEDPKLTESLTIRQRYGLFFALRARVSDRTILEIPTGWRGSDQERQFEDFLVPYLQGSANCAKWMRLIQFRMAPLKSGLSLHSSNCERRVSMWMRGAREQTVGIRGTRCES